MAGIDRIRNSAAGALLLIAGFVTAFRPPAQDWPSRTSRSWCRSAAGSASDIAARVVAEQLSGSSRRTFMVENRPGAGGTIGAGVVAQAAPDGYTILAYGALSTAKRSTRSCPTTRSTTSCRSSRSGSRRRRSRPRLQGLQDARRPDRRRQGQAGRAELFVGRRRLGIALRSGAPDGGRRHYGPAYPVQGLGRIAPTKSSRGAWTSASSRSRRPCRWFRMARSVRARGQCAQTVGLVPDVPTTIEAGLPPNSVYPFYTGSICRRRRRATSSRSFTPKSPRRCRRPRCRPASRARRRAAADDVRGIRHISPGRRSLSTMAVARAAKIKQQ